MGLHLGQQLIDHGGLPSALGRAAAPEQEVGLVDDQEAFILRRFLEGLGDLLLGGAHPHGQ